jgi:glycogen operon protein
VTWFGPDGDAPAWHGAKNCLGYMLAAAPPQDSRPAGRHVLVLTNASEEEVEFTLPPAALGLSWRLFIDTSARSPLDIYPGVDGPPLTSVSVRVPPRSLMCFVARP